MAPEARQPGEPTKVDQILQNPTPTQPDGRQPDAGLGPVMPPAAEAPEVTLRNTQQTPGLAPAKPGDAQSTRREGPGEPGAEELPQVPVPGRRTGPGVAPTGAQLEDVVTSPGEPGQGPQTRAATADQPAARQVLASDQTETPVADPAQVREGGQPVMAEPRRDSVHTDQRTGAGQSLESDQRGRQPGSEPESAQAAPNEPASQNAATSAGQTGQAPLEDGANLHTIDEQERLISSEGVPASGAGVSTGVSPEEAPGAPAPENAGGMPPKWPGEGEEVQWGDRPEHRRAKKVLELIKEKYTGTEYGDAFFIDKRFGTFLDSSVKTTDGSMRLATNKGLPFALVSPLGAIDILVRPTSQRDQYEILPELIASFGPFFDVEEIKNRGTRPKEDRLNIEMMPDAGNDKLWKITPKTSGTRKGTGKKPDGGRPATSPPDESSAASAMPAEVACPEREGPREKLHFNNDGIRVGQEITTRNNNEEVVTFRAYDLAGNDLLHPAIAGAAYLEGADIGSGTGDQGVPASGAPDAPAADAANPPGGPGGGEVFHSEASGDVPRTWEEATQFIQPQGSVQEQGENVRQEFTRSVAERLLAYPVYEQGIDFGDAAYNEETAGFRLKLDEHHAVVFGFGKINFDTRDETETTQSVSFIVVQHVDTSSEPAIYPDGKRIYTRQVHIYTYTQNEEGKVVRKDYGDVAERMKLLLYGNPEIQQHMLMHEGSVFEDIERLETLLQNEDYFTQVQANEELSASFGVNNLPIGEQELEGLLAVANMARFVPRETPAEQDEPAGPRQAGRQEDDPGDPDPSQDNRETVRTWFELDQDSYREDLNYDTLPTFAGIMEAFGITNPDDIANLDISLLKKFIYGADQVQHKIVYNDFDTDHPMSVLAYTILEQASKLNKTGELEIGDQEQSALAALRQHETFKVTSADSEEDFWKNLSRFNEFEVTAQTVAALFKHWKLTYITRAQREHTRRVLEQENVSQESLRSEIIAGIDVRPDGANIVYESISDLSEDLRGFFTPDITGSFRYAHNNSLMRAMSIDSTFIETLTEQLHRGGSEAKIDRLQEELQRWDSGSKRKPYHDSVDDGITNPYPHSVFSGYGIGVYHDKEGYHLTMQDRVGDTDKPTELIEDFAAYSGGKEVQYTGLNVKLISMPSQDIVMFPTKNAEDVWVTIKVPIADVAQYFGMIAGLDQQVIRQLGEEVVKQQNSQTRRKRTLTSDGLKFIVSRDPVRFGAGRFDQASDRESSVTPVETSSGGNLMIQLPRTEFTIEGNDSQRINDLVTLFTEANNVVQTKLAGRADISPAVWTYELPPEK